MLITLFKPFFTDTRLVVMKAIVLNVTSEYLLSAEVRKSVTFSAVDQQPKISDLMTLMDFAQETL